MGWVGDEERYNTDSLRKSGDQVGHCPLMETVNPEHGLCVYFRGVG